MNLFDGVIIVVLAYCLIRGIFRGLIKEISSLVGVLGGFYAAYSYYTSVAKLLSRWISNAGYLNILSFLIIFFVVFFVISILGVIINYLLKIAFMGWIDRICGAGFGARRGGWIVSVMLEAVTLSKPNIFRTSIRIGIFGKERIQYWNLLVWTLFRCPKLLPLAITLAIHGYHFRKICKL